MKKIPKSTKQSKHNKDNEKRKESLESKLRERLNQKQLIKNALAKLDAPNTSKKIVFDDDVEEDTPPGNVDTPLSANEQRSCGRMLLFDGSDHEEDSKFEIKIRDHFEGKKGHKLLNLQSGYNNDERFKLDERFVDSDESDDEGTAEKDEESDIKGGLSGEKAKQMEILGKVLGQPVQTKSEKKDKKGLYEMIRFDASNEDHRRRDDKSIEGDKSKPEKVKKRKRKDEREEADKAPVSAEKFYQVSDDLRSALKDKKKGGQFSLLAAFSRNQPQEEEEEEEAEETEEAEEAEEAEEEEDALLTEVNESERKEVEGAKPEATKVSGISRERFFFDRDDPRFAEGSSFINKKNSEEANEAVENYEGTRKDIREVLRLRWQKHRQRQNPFKKKLGGGGGGSGSSKWARVGRSKMKPFSKGGRRFGRR